MTGPYSELLTQLPQEADDKLTSDVAYLMQECDSIGLTVTVAYICDRGNEIKDARATGIQARELAVGIERCMMAEARAKVFLYLRDDRQGFWIDPAASPKPDLFGKEVSARFGSATYDIDEAARCLALERNTACVFHLMRVLEIGLTELGKVFNVEIGHRTWAPVIEQIESCIREMPKSPQWKSRPDCKQQQEFYAQAASHFGVLKDAWRNCTAHARYNYSDQEALSIFNNTRDFMQKLASKL